MKRIFLILICFIMLVGCTLGNTPTARVEEMLSSYQMLRGNVSVLYTDLTSDVNLSQNIRDRYEDVIEKQYRDLSYEVKDEVIDGDTAVVTIQIKVMNYKSSIDKYNKDDYDLNRYYELVLKDMEDTKEMVTYTLDISLTKKDDDTWVVDNLTEENRDKLLGIY